MKIFNSRFLVVTAIVILLVFSNFAANTYATSNEMASVLGKTNLTDINEKEYPPIIIFYSKGKPIIEWTASAVNSYLLSLYDSVLLIDVQSLSDIKLATDTLSPIISIYIFDTNLRGCYISSKHIPWNIFAKFLVHYIDSYHILSMGNTYSFKYFADNSSGNLFFMDKDVVDATEAVLFSLWTVSDVVKLFPDIFDDEIALSFKKLALVYFGNKFNDLFAGSISPSRPLGVENQTKVEEHKKDVLSRFPNYATRLPNVASDKFNASELLDMINVKREANGTTTVSIASMDKLDFESSSLPKLEVGESGAEDLVEIISFPRKSGLDGPVGKVIDFLLDTFMDSDLGDVIGFPLDVATLVINAFNAIKSVVSIIEEDGIKSLLKVILDILKEQFPFPEELTAYFDLFIDLLFALRGNLDDIIDAVWSVINALFPTISGIVEDIKLFLKYIFSMGEDLYDAIANSDNIFDVILSWFTKMLSGELIEQFLNETIGFAHEAFTTLFNRISNVVFSVIELISTFNITSFLAIFGDMLQNAFNILTGAEDFVLELIQKFIKLCMIALGYSEESLIDVIKEILSEIIPSTALKAGVTFLSLGEQIVSRIDKAVKDAETVITNLINDIISYISSSLTSVNAISEAKKNIIANIVAVIAGIINPEFDISGIPTLLDVILDTLIEFGVANLDSTFQVINCTLTTILGILAFVLDNDYLKQILMGQPFEFDKAFPSLFELIINGIICIMKQLLTQAQLEQFRALIETIANIIQTILSLIGQVIDSTFQGIMQILLLGASYSSLAFFGNITLGNFTIILQVLFPKLLGIICPPAPSVAIDIILESLSSFSSAILDTIYEILSFIFDIKDVFIDGIRWIVSRLVDWLEGQISALANLLISQLREIFDDFSIASFGGNFGIDLGGLTDFGFKFAFGLDIDFGIDKQAMYEFLGDILFKGLKWDSGSVKEIFQRFTSFFQAIPVFVASLDISGVGSGESEFMDFLLDFLGVEISFSGDANFKVQLFNFKGSAFDWSEFMKLLEWTLHFSIEIGKTFTLLDFLTGGVGGSALTTLADWIGLDSISVTINFGIMFEIIQKAASITGPAQGTMTIQISIGAALHIGLSIIIAGISIDGSLEIVFTFIQDLVGDMPLKIFMDIIASVKVTITAFCIDLDVSWGPKTIYHHDFTAGSKSEAKGQALGYDSDDDGLPDEYEENTPGLSPNSPDTDGDGINDKEEIKVLNTDPILKDTDGDGLSDYDEHMKYRTNPLSTDSDHDRISDYDEIIIYGTNPLAMDTDGDGLDDYYEINHAWDISKITPSVTEVVIGGVSYNDHTDPLNPDTDGDGIPDGEEGPRGGYYGLDDLYEPTEPSSAEPLIFNDGYTHPLDNDTDDDSYLQLHDGAIAPVNEFLRSMTDKEEIDGIWVTLINATTGEPYRKLIRTNPCNPDTDGDTVRQFPIQIDAYLYSDGFELSLDPPSDPTDGDSDDDGLIDGLEGVLSETSNHTHYLNPDTDNDGLGDLQDLLLGTDPRDADTDGDMVSDGDEFFKYYTDPTIADTDFDGLSDGEELFIWHTNPFLKDSDGDRLSDGDEVFIYYSNPMDEDSDDDGIDDFYEVMAYGTDPLDDDSDDDGLLDGYELLYNTDPLDWDTDNDSIIYPNEYGQKTWSMSDGDEVLIYGTDPGLSDTDGDGISDGIELYLGSGLIPSFTPIKLNATNNDTDADGLLDGEELRIQNISQIVYPYVALVPLYVYNSSPVMNDTDSDGLSDYDEIVTYHSLPYTNDSDNDTLSDYYEVFVLGTDPIKNDTDGDGLYDWEETGGGSPLTRDQMFRASSIYATATYDTDPTDPDSDDDYLPDGYEVIQGMDPASKDENGNRIPDGLEIDSDNDGLSDGEEFYIWRTQLYPGGGIYNPDSDMDGLNDGDEVYVYHTNVTNPDTDGDGIIDGIEVLLGLDPLSYTSPEQYEAALDQYRRGGVIQIISPLNTTISDIGVDILAINATNITAMWFRYNYGTGWSDNISMTYDPTLGMWRYAKIVWNDSTTYHLQVFGNTSAGEVVMDEVWFTIGPAPMDFTIYYYVGGVAGVAAGSGLLLLLLKKRGIFFRKKR